MDHEMKYDLRHVASRQQGGRSLGIMYIIFVAFAVALGVLSSCTSDKTDGRRSDGPHHTLTDGMKTDTDDASSLGSKDGDSGDRLGAMLAEANKRFPKELTEGITIEKIYDDGDCLLFLGDCDEDIIDMDLVEENKSDMRASIKEMIASGTDPSV